MAEKAKKTNRNEKETKRGRDWYKEYRTSLSKCSEKDRDLLEEYRDVSLKAIEYVAKEEYWSDYELFEQIKENYSYEFICQRMESLLMTKPPLSNVFYWAKKLCSVRKPSWIESDVRRRESVSVMTMPLEIEYGETGAIADFGLSDSVWEPPINPPDLCKRNTENCIMDLDIYQITKQLPSIVGAMKVKWASVYEKILTLQLNGTDVCSRHSPLFGIKPEEVKDLKFQARQIARKVLVDFFPELAERQALYDVQKGKKWRIKKSNFEDRRALYQQPNSAEMEPRTIRDWKVIRN